MYYIFYGWSCYWKYRYLDKMYFILETVITEYIPFYVNCSSQDNSLTDEINMDMWEEQTFLSHGALLAKSCQAAMELAKHDKDAQGLAYKYGKHLSLGHKASIAGNLKDWLC